MAQLEYADLKTRVLKVCCTAPGISTSTKTPIMSSKTLLGIYKLVFRIAQLPLLFFLLNRFEIFKRLVQMLNPSSHHPETSGLSRMIPRPRRFCSKRKLSGGSNMASWVLQVV